MANTLFTKSSRHLLKVTAEAEIGEIIVIKAQTSALHEPVLQVSVCRTRWKNRKAGAIVKEANKQPEEASNSSKGIKRGPRARQAMP